MSEQIGKYLAVQELRPREGRKTKRWMLFSHRGALLGEVKWYGPWRQYIVEPNMGSVFNDGCLLDVAAFLARVNYEHTGRWSEQAYTAHHDSDRPCYCEDCTDTAHGGEE